MAALQADRLLNAIIKEGMRMYPPVPVGFPRTVPAQGVHVRGYKFPGKTRLAIYQFATYRSEELWREPDSFRPERWMGDEKYKNDRFDAYEPFSVGLRACSAQVCLFDTIKEMF